MTQNERLETGKRQQDRCFTFQFVEGNSVPALAIGDWISFSAPVQRAGDRESRVVEALRWLPPCNGELFILARNSRDLDSERASMHACPRPFNPSLSVR